MNNVKKLRERLGFSQQGLADRVGVHKNTVINWETGATDMKSADLVKLAGAFGCAIEDIVLADAERVSATYRDEREAS